MNVFRGGFRSDHSMTFLSIGSVAFFTLVKTKTNKKVPHNHDLAIIPDLCLSTEIGKYG